MSDAKLELALKYGCWPLIVFMLVVVVVLVFKAALASAIGRIKSVGKIGLDLSTPEQDRVVKTDATSGSEFQKQFDNQLLVAREVLVRKMVDDLSKDGTDREAVLKRFLAVAWIVNDFEAAHMRIFGSQLAVVSLANECGDQGLALDRVRAIYDEASRAFPDRYSGDTIDRWLGFLQAHSLITRKDDLVLITLDGREFLRYLVEKGYPLVRLG